MTCDDEGSDNVEEEDVSDGDADDDEGLDATSSFVFKLDVVMVSIGSVLYSWIADNEGT